MLSVLLGIYISSVIRVSSTSKVISVIRISDRTHLRREREMESERKRERERERKTDRTISSDAGVVGFRGLDARV